METGFNKIIFAFALICFFAFQVHAQEQKMRFRKQ
jgi:hypothetical protein